MTCPILWCFNTIASLENLRRPARIKAGAHIYSGEEKHHRGDGLFLTTNSVTVHRLAGVGDTRPTAGVTATADQFVRCEFPCVFRVALCAPLVRSMEPEVVLWFLAGHLSAPCPPVDRTALLRIRPAHVVSRGATGC